MNGTKQKILRAARFLFNQNGVPEISQRAISDHIAISPGNLTYHFKKRDEIIEALYFELAEEIEKILEVAKSKPFDLENLDSVNLEMNKIYFEYRFFIIDYNHIIRSNKNIHKSYIKLCEKRQLFLNNVVNSLIEEGEMRQEILPNEYELFFKRAQLCNEYWIVSIESQEKEIKLKHTRIYSQLFMQSIFPYLTNKGEKTFRKLFV